MKIFWFDTETSGLEPGRNGIIQLAYIVEIDGKIKEKKILNSNCNGKELDQRALDVNGYTREQISEFPDHMEMYLDLIDTLSKYVNKFDRADKFFIGGYNAGFDRRFLQQLWMENNDKYFGSFFHYPMIDPSAILPVLQIAGAAYPGSDYKLTSVAEWLGIDLANAHDALADIEATRSVCIELMYRYVEAKK